MTIVGFPRIGENRELKKALESFWGGEIDKGELYKVAKDLRRLHWGYQKNLSHVVVNDFSLYDNMLDLSIALGALPERFRGLEGEELYFSIARGNKENIASEMTKWFNTNYHFIVPELSINDEYKPNISKIKNEYLEAKALGYRVKISLIGFFTYVNLAKSQNNEVINNPTKTISPNKEKNTSWSESSCGCGSCNTQNNIDSNIFKKEIFEKLRTVYIDLVKEISTLEKDILIEFHEPIFVKGKFEFEGLNFSESIKDFYNEISSLDIKAVVTTYFEESTEATEALLQTGIDGLGLDFLLGQKNFDSLGDIAKSGKKLYAGIIDGRNIWAANIKEKLEILNKIASIVPKDLVVISTSCSLLHTPFGKDNEVKMDKEILSWISFAREKIKEIELLESIFRNGLNETNQAQFNINQKIFDSKKTSQKIHNEKVQNRVKTDVPQRELCFKDRIEIQRQELKLPPLPTTTIGSFPQTPELRALRLKFKKNEISKDEYENSIKEYIKDCIKIQEDLDIDVLVHGEPERNDMVEYFGEQLSGFVFSQNGWVQSYGSRCVKPPIIYGDVDRPSPMTVKWAKFAQSLSKKIVKGMLTGPVTILNWSFVRDDISRKEVCKQLSFCIRDEINDLQNAGIRVVQVDEAAFKEGYPLRESKIKEYEDFALECFKISTSIAWSNTQIHTHMCYSEFNNIIKTIEAMDADVISIETARSGNELLKIFKAKGYSNEVGPGVYDIHSPRIPSEDEIYKHIKLLLEVLPKEQLWINPDCGLKTRKWKEVIPSLENLVKAVKRVRSEM